MTRPPVRERGAPPAEDLVFRPEHLRVLAVIDAARGEPVSFEALAEHGVGRPAMLVYELEAVGCGIERVFRGPAGGHKYLAGVRRAPGGQT